MPPSTRSPGRRALVARGRPGCGRRPPRAPATGRGRRSAQASSISPRGRAARRTRRPCRARPCSARRPASPSAAHLGEDVRHHVVDVGTRAPTGAAGRASKGGGVPRRSSDAEGHEVTRLPAGPAGPSRPTAASGAPGRARSAIIGDVHPPPRSRPSPPPSPSCTSGSPPWRRARWPAATRTWRTSSSPSNAPSAGRCAACAASPRARPGSSRRPGLSRGASASLRPRRARARGPSSAAAVRRTVWRCATTAQLRRSASSTTATTLRSDVSQRAAISPERRAASPAEGLDLGAGQQLADPVAARLGAVPLGHRHRRDRPARSRWTARRGAAPTSCGRRGPPHAARPARRRDPRGGWRSPATDARGHAGHTGAQAGQQCLARRELLGAERPRLTLPGRHAPQSLAHPQLLLGGRREPGAEGDPVLLGRLLDRRPPPRRRARRSAWSPWPRG